MVNHIGTGLDFWLGLCGTCALIHPNYFIG